MSYFFLFLFNSLCYVLILKINFLIVRDKYYFPFRVADLLTFIICSSIFLLYTMQVFGHSFMLITLIININFFYIFFHLLNMINTSPRTKIILTIFQKKKIKENSLLKNYNENIISSNRIERLMTSKQIKKINNNYFLNNKNFFSFAKLINFLFKIIKKI